MRALPKKYPKSGSIYEVLLAPEEALKLLECDPDTMRRLENLLARIGVVSDKEE